MGDSIQIPEMLMIGSAGRNAGKTGFACSVIKKFASRSIIGLKVTTITEKGGACPRGGEGCGVCSSLEGDYCITDEEDAPIEKDTGRLLAAGAKQVFWLRVLKSHLKEGINAVLEKIEDGSLIVCESNSLREVVSPGLFLMAKDEDNDYYKDSAVAVRRFADAVIGSEDGVSKFDFDMLRIDKGHWSLVEDATAVIMAGGMSSRAGQDKAMLSVSGVSMIQHIYNKLKHNFKEVIISADDVEKYSFLGARVVPDRLAGKGPLGGIESALTASNSELNLIVACDMPEFDVSFARQMLAVADDYDVVVPEANGRPEPLFAVYRKSVRDEIGKMLSREDRKIRLLFDNCRTKYVELPLQDAVMNINTMEEYDSYVNKFEMKEGAI